MTTQKPIKYIPEDKCYVFECPICGLLTQVEETQINCGIFRHGTMKSTGIQVNPHASKEHCDRLVKNNLVDGCCKPFKIFRDNYGSISYADVCDYI